MEPCVTQAAFPRNDARTLSDDGDALHFCSTCAFSQACLSEGMEVTVALVVRWRWLRTRALPPSPSRSAAAARGALS